MRRLLSCKALFITPTFAWKINPHHLVMCRLEQEICPNRNDRHTHRQFSWSSHITHHMYKLWSDLSGEFPLSPLLLASLDLLRGYGLSGAGLGVGVMCRPPRPLLGVVMLPPLGPPVLEPDLETKGGALYMQYFEKSAANRLNQSL